MNALAKNPSTVNYLSEVDFRLFVKKLPHVNFFCTAVSLPGLSIGEGPDFPTPLVRIPSHGDHVLFEQLGVTFKVDENMDNYLEIFNWLVALGFPKDSDQYKKLASVQKEMLGEGLESDAVVHIMTSSRNPHIEYTFVDAFPRSLSGPKLAVGKDDVSYVEATAIFEYLYFEVERI